MFSLNAIARSLLHGEVPSRRRSAFPSISQELTRNANRKSATPVAVNSPTVKCPAVRPQRYTCYTHEGQGLDVSHQFRSRLSVSWWFCPTNPTPPIRRMHLLFKPPGDGRQSQISHFLSPSPGLPTLSQTHACLVAAFSYFRYILIRC